MSNDIKSRGPVAAPPTNITSGTSPAAGQTKAKSGAIAPYTPPVDGLDGHKPPPLARSVSIASGLASPRSGGVSTSPTSLSVPSLDKDVEIDDLARAVDQFYAKLASTPDAKRKTAAMNALFSPFEQRPAAAG